MEKMENIKLEFFSKADWSRLGLVVPPFSIEADPRFMYISVDTRRALSKVSFMVESGQGLSLIHIWGIQVIPRSVVR